MEPKAREAEKDLRPRAWTRRHIRLLNLCRQYTSCAFGTPFALLHMCWAPRAAASGFAKDSAVRRQRKLRQ